MHFLKMGLKEYLKYCKLYINMKGILGVNKEGIFEYCKLYINIKGILGVYKEGILEYCIHYINIKEY